MSLRAEEEDWDSVGDGTKSILWPQFVTLKDYVPFFLPIYVTTTTIIIIVVIYCIYIYCIYKYTKHALMHHILLSFFSLDFDGFLLNSIFTRFLLKSTAELQSKKNHHCFLSVFVMVVYLLL